MKKILFLLVIANISLHLFAQNCMENENIIRFMTRGKMALKTAKNPEDYKLAANEFLKALEYDVKCPDVYYQLALCYEPMGEIDPGNFQEAKTYLETYLAFRPDAEDKQEIQEKIYELEFLIEKSGGISLNELVGKWKFYWGTGEEDDFFDIEIYLNMGDYYVKYCGDKRIMTQISMYRGGAMDSEKHILRNDYESSIIQYKDGIIILNVKPYFQTSEYFPKEGNLCRFNNGTGKYWKIEYRLKLEEGILKGERIHKGYEKVSSSGCDWNWQTDYECISDCNTYPVYFEKQGYY